MPATPPTDRGPSQPAIQSLLDRPQAQRLREYKYRFAQAIVFGLPVLALQWFGPLLGGDPREADRWVGLLQALLAGWVTYVGAAGMFMEGILMLPRRLMADLPVAVAAVGCYLYSVISVPGVLLRGQPSFGPLVFHWCIILLAGWCGIRWWWMSRIVGANPNPANDYTA